MKLDRLFDLEGIHKIDRIHLCLIGGIALVAGIMIYLVLMQQGPAIRCGFC